MGVFTSASTDWTGLARGFESWVRRQDAGPPTVAAFRAASDASGYSNETFLATLDYPGGHRQDIIVRAGPGLDAPGFFPSYNMRRQYQVMRMLADNSDVPVPACRWYEEDTELFGTPFFVMEMVQGDIPKDHPLFTTAGFVADATPETRRSFWDATVSAIARLGKLDWRAAGLDFVDWPSNGRSRADQLIDYWENYYHWSLGDAEKPDDHVEVEAIGRWLRTHQPADEPAALVWGDSRFGNVIYREFRPVALLDWEMATINNPLMDLAYFLFHEQLNVVGMSNAKDARPRLAGFPSHAETIAAYERLTGREAREMRYYWIMNGYKLRIMAERAFRLFEATGKVKPDEIVHHRTTFPVVAWTRAAMDSASFPVQPNF